MIPVPIPCQALIKPYQYRYYRVQQANQRIGFSQAFAGSRRKKPPLIRTAANGKAEALAKYAFAFYL